MKKIQTILLLILLLIVTAFTSATGYANTPSNLNNPSSLPGRTVYIRHDPDAPLTTYVAPPFDFLQTAVQTADIQINFIGSWPADAQNAITFAANIWETQISSAVPIVIDVEFSSTLPAGVLGGAGPADFYRSPTLPINDTWYPMALANAILGADINGSDAEIGAAFSSTFSWYYGTDGNPPANQIDFVTVALHEIGHGLGFTDSMNISSGLGSWGQGSGFPFVYDRFLKNGGGTSLVSGFANNSIGLASQLTSNNIFFDGPFTNIANGSPAKLYAPNPFAPGSSIAHLDEIYNGTPNSLMTFSVGSGSANHNPGPVTLAMFRDMGWSLDAPTLLDLPTILIQTGDNADNAIDLWAYASDTTDPDSALTFEITAEADPTSGVSLDSNRYIDVNPTDLMWIGSSTITVKVTDTDGFTAQKSFQVVSGDITMVYLPMISK